MALRSSRQVMSGPPARLPSAWRTWVIENYVLGTPVHMLKETLVSQGLSAAAAEALVAAEVAHPYAVGGRRAASMTIKLESLLDTYGQLYRLYGARREVESRDKLSREDFLEQYYIPNWSVRVRGALEDWSALKRWSLERFFARRSRTTRALALGPRALQPLLDDIPPPAYAAAHSPRTTVWRCPSGAALPLRQGLRNVLLCQVLGTTRARLLPSFRLHRACRGRVDPRAVELTPPRTRPAGSLTCELQPGELLFLPVGWWHELQATGPGVCVSFEAFAAPEPNVDWR